jgi:hypothetical protein
MPTAGSLGQTLESVRKRIVRARGKALNEENTKATLIEPVLQALGWDTQDIDEVAREYREKAKDKPVDYALLALREPRLFVEAKALGQNLDDRKWANQIMGYAAVAGVSWIVLTDGDQYRIYNPHAPVKVDEKLLVSVRISAAEGLAQQMLALLSKDQVASDRLKALWDAQFIDRQVRAALNRLFSREEDMTLVNHVRRCAPSLTADQTRSSLRRCTVQFDFPVSPDKLVPVGPEPQPKIVSYGVSLSALIEAGCLSPPVKLTCRYKGRDLEARIVKAGDVECLGERYQSLSLAGGAARASIIGRRPDGGLPPTNGWAFWRVRAADGKLRPIDHARQRFLKERRSGLAGKPTASAG